MRRRLGLVALVALLLAAIAALLPGEATPTGARELADGAPSPTSALDGVDAAAGASSSTSSSPAAPGSAAVEPAAIASGALASDGLGATLELLVVRADDEAPAAGAEVIASVAKERTTVRTGLDGRATLRLRPGFLTVEARADGFRSGVAARQLGDGEVGSVRLELLRAGHGLRGVVVDPERRPLAGALVEGGAERVLTDAQGAFALEDLTESVQLVVVSAPGFLRLFVRLYPESPPGPPHQLVLRRAVRLEGQVLARGTGAPAAWLVDVPGPRGQVKAGADGRFVAEPLEGGAEALIVVRSVDPQGGVWGAARRIQLEPTGTTRATFEVTGPGGLSGRVVRQGGSPLTLTVRVETLGGGDAREFQVMDDGRFELLNLPSGPARVTVGPWTFPHGPPRELELLPDQTTRVELLVVAAHDVAGVVVGTDGAPVEGATVYLTRGDEPRAKARCDLRGRFVIRGLPAGRWALVAEDARLSRLSPPLELVVDAGVADVRLVVGPAARLSGRVVDGAGRPVLGAALALLRPTGPDPLHQPKRTDATGRVELTGLAPGRVELRLDDDEVLRRVARRRGVAATRCDPAAVELRAGEASEVVLRLVDDAGGQ